LKVEALNHQFAKKYYIEIDFDIDGPGWDFQCNRRQRAADTGGTFEARLKT
jgi:hypothetical protein